MVMKWGRTFTHNEVFRDRFKEFCPKNPENPETKWTEAAIYLPWHFIGLVFYVWFYTISLALTPTGRIKWNSIFWIIYLTINILTVYILTPQIGLYAFWGQIVPARTS